MKYSKCGFYFSFGCLSAFCWLVGCSVITETVMNKNRAFKHKNLFPRIGYIEYLNLFYVTFSVVIILPQYIRKQIIVLVSYEEDRSLKCWERILCCYNRNGYTVWLRSFCQNFPTSTENTNNIKTVTRIQVIHNDR